MITKKKYNLDYYINSKEIENRSTYLAIRIWLACKPFAAYDLISALKNEVDMPIHTTMTWVMALRCIWKLFAGADIVDGDQ